MKPLRQPILDQTKATCSCSRQSRVQNIQLPKSEKYGCTGSGVLRTSSSQQRLRTILKAQKKQQNPGDTLERLGQLLGDEDEPDPPPPPKKKPEPEPYDEDGDIRKPIEEFGVKSGNPVLQEVEEKPSTESYVQKRARQRNEASQKRREQNPWGWDVSDEAYDQYEAERPPITREEFPGTDEQWAKFEADFRAQEDPGIKGFFPRVFALIRFGAVYVLSQRSTWISIGLTAVAFFALFQVTGSDFITQGTGQQALEKNQWYGSKLGDYYENQELLRQKYEAKQAQLEDERRQQELVQGKYSDDMDNFKF